MTLLFESIVSYFGNDQGAKFSAVQNGSSIIVTFYDDDGGYAMRLVLETVIESEGWARIEVLALPLTLEGELLYLLDEDMGPSAIAELGEVQESHFKPELHAYEDDIPFIVFTENMRVGRNIVGEGVLDGLEDTLGILRYEVTTMLPVYRHLAKTDELLEGSAAMLSGLYHSLQ